LTFFCSCDELQVRPRNRRAGELTDSEAVRTALREAAARRRVRSALHEEVRRLAADEGDREEMRIVREQLAELAPRSRG
jgi:hypothetical protein